MWRIIIITFEYKGRLFEINSEKKKTNGSISVPGDNLKIRNEKLHAWSAMRISCDLKIQK